MIIEQVYTKCLSQASYYVESEGCAVVIDPIRDVDGYIQTASKRGAKINYVLLTHFHADFVSGHLELAKKTGAIIVLGPNAKPSYHALVAQDKEYISLGKCKIEVLHTPGHTIESSCFLLFDEQAKPYAIFTGDTLFVGDTGRPDLLSGNLSAEELANQLFDSLQTKIKTLPDDVMVYPGHGAGSACGKNLGKETWSTIGEQKKMNYALQLNRKEFVTAVTTDQPIAPAYFFKDAVINKKGYESLDTVLERTSKALSIEAFKAEVNNGALILDVRSTATFSRQFIKGAINVSLDGQYAIWVGTLIEFNTPLLIVADEGEEQLAIIRLARIGYDNVKGYLAGGMLVWVSAHESVDAIRTITVDELKTNFSSSDFKLLDVRRKNEFDTEHLPDTIHIPLDQLSSRMNELDKHEHYAVCCAGGYRSMIASSILQKNGFDTIINIDGGIAKIKSAAPELLEVF